MMIPNETLPPLYKYLDFKGAMLTLMNRKFKFSKPSDFNDLEDLTIGSIYPEPIEDALTRIENGFTDIVIQNLDQEPTCEEPRRSRMAALQALYRKNPHRADFVKATISSQGNPRIFNRESMRSRSEELIRFINNFLQGFRVFCVTTDIGSELMWTKYAEGHTGIALRIAANLQSESFFSLFRAVEYRDQRPSLYEHTLDFVSHSFFGDPQAHRLAMMQRIIHTKTKKWSHENEYRLAVALREGEEPWNTLPFSRDSVTELHLGADMRALDKVIILRLARSLNPSMLIYQVERDREGNLHSVRQ